MTATLDVHVSVPVEPAVVLLVVASVIPNDELWIADPFAESLRSVAPVHENVYATCDAERALVTSPAMAQSSLVVVIVGVSLFVDDVLT
jgi:hypothetical protein